MVREIAHRGYAARAPENTVPAVRAAARRADAVEVDVRRCADGLVAVHDATVDRVTDATGPVASYTAAELDALHVLGGDAGIPRLEAVLRAAWPAADLVVELKERQLAADVLALAASVGADVTVSSFDPAALREARDADPSVPRALLFEAGDELETAADLGCEAVHVEAGHCLRSDVVAAAHDAGFAVAAWTVRTRAGARLLAARGVDALITDLPLATA